MNHLYIHLIWPACMNWNWSGIDLLIEWKWIKYEVMFRFVCKNLPWQCAAEFILQFLGLKYLMQWICTSKIASRYYSLKNRAALPIFEMPWPLCKWLYQVSVGKCIQVLRNSVSWFWVVCEMNIYHRF